MTQNATASQFDTLINATGSINLSVARVRALCGSALIGHWPFNEASGSTAIDYSGNGRNLSYIGTPVYSAAGIDDGLNSINFNAAAEVDGYTAAVAGAWSGDAGLVAYWAAMNSAASWSDGVSYSLSFHGASPSQYYWIRKNVDGVLVFIGLRSNLVSVSLMPPTTTRLFHAAFAWDTANDRMIAYLNGSKQKPTTTIGTWAGSLASGYARFADTSPGIANANWPGRMAHGVLCSTPLTDAKVFDLAQAVGQVIIAGDSRSDNAAWYASAIEQALPYDDFAFGHYGVASWAVSGDDVVTMASRAATGVDTLIQSDVNNVLVVWCGVNGNGSYTAQELYDQLAAYCVSRRAAGYDKILLCTEIDAVTAGWTAKYQALNTLINASHAFCDALIPLGANALLQNSANTAIFSDGTHLTAAGYAVVAGIAAPILATVM